MAEGDPAVVRRDALVPIWAEAFLAQAFDGAFGQVAVLETAARKGDSLLFEMTRDGENGFYEGIVEFGRDLPRRGVAREIVKNRENKRGPIQDKRRVRSVECGMGSGERIGRGQREWVRLVGLEMSEGEFEFHGGLTFETDHLTKTDEGGDGVEKAADTRGQR